MTRQGARMVAAAVAIAVVVAGCGGGDGEDPVSSAPVPTTSNASAALASVRARLEAAGFRVTGGNNEATDPPAIGALTADLKTGGEVAVYVFESSADATEAAGPYEELEQDKELADITTIAVDGSNLYVAAANDADGVDAGEFNQVVRAGQGS